MALQNHPLEKPDNDPQGLILQFPKQRKESIEEVAVDQKNNIISLFKHKPLEEFVVEKTPEVWASLDDQMAIYRLDDLDLASVQEEFDALDPERGAFLAFELLGRGGSSEIPYQEQLIPLGEGKKHKDVQRMRAKYDAYIKELKLSVHKMQPMLQRFTEILELQESNTLSGEAEAQLEEEMDKLQPALMQVQQDLLTLYALYKKRARWLEASYYPVMFQDTIRAARGEVTQLLMKRHNTNKLEKWQDLNKVPVHLEDQLNFMKLGGSESAVGAYSSAEKSVHISLEPHMTYQDEWKVFKIAAHELIHAASHHKPGWVGVQRDAEGEELNEALTELLTYRLTQKHLAAQKTYLEGQHDRPPSLSDHAYFEYTFVVRQIFSKIPEQMFYDAMFNKAGLKRLSDTFDEVYGEPEALPKFVKNLQDMYAPNAKVRREPLIY